MAGYQALGFASFDEFCAAPPPNGLGKTKIAINIEVNQRKVAQTQMMAESAKPLAETPGGDKKSGQYKNHSYNRKNDFSENAGNNAEYLTARIARDNPAILEDMKQGKYRSVRAAAIDADRPGPKEGTVNNPNGNGGWSGKKSEEKNLDNPYTHKDYQDRDGYPKYGTNPTYLLERIEKEHPAETANIGKGKPYKTVHEAARKLGIVKDRKRLSFYADDPAAAGRYLASRVDEDWIGAMLETYQGSKAPTRLTPLCLSLNHLLQFPHHTPIEPYNHESIKMRILTFANQKGGVAKTTSAVNVAVGLVQRRRRVLLVDADPQANATYATIGAAEPALTIYDLLINDATLEACTVATRLPRLKIVPSSIDLAGAEIELLSETGGQTLLRSKLRGADYDYIVIDAPPSLGLLCVNCLAAATEVLIPVAVGIFALKGLAQLEATIEKVRTRLDRPDLRIGGVFATMTDNTNVSKDVVAAIRERYGDVAFSTAIPKTVRLEEAHSRTLSIFEHEPTGAGARAYDQLIEEIVNRGN